MLTVYLRLVPRAWPVLDQFRAPGQRAPPIAPALKPRYTPAAMIEAPFRRYRATVPPDWIDYNGHMNVAFYVLAFDKATDVLFDALGLGVDYVKATNQSSFTLEAHIAYERELKLGDPLMVASLIVAADRKRLHLFQEMFHATEGYRAATFETLNIHVDLGQRRSAPFPSGLQARLDAAAMSHAGLPRPASLGRGISMRKS
jgi:acyl-CoA thioester hydrolase